LVYASECSFRPTIGQRSNKVIDVNHVAVTGKLGQDPDVRKTTTGKTVVNFSLAAENGFGENKRDPFWFNVVAWEEVAESLTAKKGSKVTVYGKLTQRSYQNKAGQKINTVEIVAAAVVLDTKHVSKAKSVAKPAQDEFDESEIPF
jgi:single-strand DNA-binding protein